MGCALSKSGAECRHEAYLRHMDKRRLPYLTHVGLLAGMARTRQWSIYVHVQAWKGTMTARAMDGLVAQFRKACAAWLRSVAGYAGFPMLPIRVRVFGFVFQDGVEFDDTFRNKYGRYPLVTGWRETGERSPWVVQHDGAPLPNPNYYRSDIDLHKLVVVGNRTGTGATFSPQEWSTYTHPEGCTGFQTKYWHGTEWAAFAQRHYLRVGGVVTDYATGRLNHTVLLHEMGHCFFLDDMYDGHKYPRPLPSCPCGGSNCALRRDDTVMFGARGLTAFDRRMLRHTWDAQRDRV